MITEEFSRGNSPIHKLDARIKVVTALIFSLMVAVSEKEVLLLSALFFSISLVAICRLNIRKVFLRLLVVNGFVFLLWLVLPVTTPGKTLFSLGPLNVTREGITYCLFITMKCNAILLACIGLLATSSVFTLVHAFRHLYVPDKMVHLFFFFFRYVHVVHLEYIKLRNALKVRCFRPRTSLHSYRTYGYLLGVLLLKSYDRSERIYKAMICRGFRGKYWVMNHFRLRKSDLAPGIILTLCITGLFFLQWIIT